jgi:hypothetical protein
MLFLPVTIVTGASQVIIGESAPAFAFHLLLLDLRSMAFEQAKALTWRA